MKIRPVGAELLHTDRHDEANRRFSQFCALAAEDCAIVMTIHNKFSVDSKRCSAKRKERQGCILIRLHRPLAIVRRVDSQG